jgi:hypothetical protein
LRQFGIKAQLTIIQNKITAVVAMPPAATRVKKALGFLVSLLWLVTVPALPRCSTIVEAQRRRSGVVARTI